MDAEVPHSSVSGITQQRLSYVFYVHAIIPHRAVEVLASIDASSKLIHLDLLKTATDWVSVHGCKSNLYGLLILGSIRTISQKQAYDQADTQKSNKSSLQVHRSFALWHHKWT